VIFSVRRLSTRLYPAIKRRSRHLHASDWRSLLINRGLLQGSSRDLYPTSPLPYM